MKRLILALCLLALTLPCFAQGQSQVSSAGAGNSGWIYSSTWVPTDYSNLAYWFTAQDLTTLYQNSTLVTAVSADGDPVGGWKDKSGGNHHVLQATAGNRPMYKASYINGHPAVIVSSVTKTLADALGNTRSQPFTVFFVALADATTTNAHIFDSKGGTGTTDRIQGLISASPKFQMNAGTTLGGITADTSAHLHILVINGANSYYAVDGATGGPTLFDTGSNSWIDLTLFGNRTGTQGFQGAIGEFIVYNALLSHQKIQQVAAYLKAQWGV